MKVLLVNDVFGKTPELLSLARELHWSSIIVDPYGGAEHYFNATYEAKKYFQRLSI
ncbi:MAG: hypothetical protein ACI93R_002059 [Flavobacteriales bacterium]